MSNQKLTELDALTAAVAADVLYIVVDVDGMPTAKRISAVNLKQSLIDIELPTPTIQITYVEAINLISAGTNIDISASTSDYTIATENGGASLGANQSEFENGNRLTINQSDNDANTPNDVAFLHTSDYTESAYYIVALSPTTTTPATLPATEAQWTTDGFSKQADLLALTPTAAVAGVSVAAGSAVTDNGVAYYNISGASQTAPAELPATVTDWTTAGFTDETALIAIVPTAAVAAASVAAGGKVNTTVSKSADVNYVNSTTLTLTADIPAGDILSIIEIVS